MFFFSAQVAPQIGTGLTFIVGPLMLPSDNSTEIDLVKSKIQNYLGLAIAFVIIPCICVFYSFDDKPPTPPSASASLPRTELRGNVFSYHFSKNICTFLVPKLLDHCATFSSI